MADFKQNINRHLNSAQQWLSEAEEAFDKDSDIRGELNLFLAQAELTRAKEANRSLRWRHRYPVLRHSLAIGLAITIAAGGMTASYLWGMSRHSAQQPLRVEESNPVLQARPSQTNSMHDETSTTVAPLTSPPESKATKAVASNDRATASQQLSTPPVTGEPTNVSSETHQAKETPLTANEVNQLIRLAGKSLRGQ